MSRAKSEPQEGGGTLLCLYWSLLPLLIGAVLPLLMIYWVLSHRLKLPFAQTWPLVGAAYTNPIDAMGSMHQWLFLPFGALTVFFFLLGNSDPRRWMIVLVAGSLVLTCLCMVPPVIHLLKETYYHDDAPPFVELSYLFIGLKPLFLLGCCVYVAASWRALRHIVAGWRDPSKRWN